MSESDESLDARVDALAQYEFNIAAQWCATQLRHHGSAYIALTPRDATSYKIAVLQWANYDRVLKPGFQDRWFMAHSFGPLYEWGGAAEVHWSYVLDKWCPPGTGTARWTARVLARFLNTLSPLVPRSTDPPQEN
jgi:hypothetical protein